MSGEVGLEHRPTQVGAGAQWPHWSERIRGERPSNDPNLLEIWGYSGQPSYRVGDTLTLHVSTTFPEFEILIYRDGATQEVVHHERGLSGRWFVTPEDAYATGCGWPAGISMEVPPTWPPGGYVVEFTARDHRGSSTHIGFFVVRAKTGGEFGRIALVLATYTWQAYNDWGGGSAYSKDPTGKERQGVDASESAGASQWEASGFSPRLSFDRPWARGLITLPVGAPRIALREPPPIGWAPRYEQAEWAIASGYSVFCGSAGWAQYDSHFVRWAERAGYGIELLTQWDLDQDPGCLSPYACVVTVGHDEYWTGQGRQELDSFIERGGRYARFAGNILWQVRLEDRGKTQVCYKYVAETDPQADAEDPTRRTGAFESLAIGDPPVTTFGANGARGVYARVGGVSPRGAGGFIVYRNDHWVFKGTDLYYGDVLGGEIPLVGYEVDGLAYTFENGMPIPTGEDGAPSGLEILALTPAALEEEDHGAPGAVLAVGDGDLAFFTRALFGSDTPEAREKVRRGAAVITWMRKGRGEVVAGGSTEWPYALSRSKPMVERVVRNVLDRFSGKEPSDPS